jgi:hypothetical protein
MQAVLNAVSAPRTRTRRALIWSAVCVAALAGGNAAAQNNQASQRCQELEQRLVSEWHRGNNPQEAVVRIDRQLETSQRERRQLEVEAERRECYEEFFIFGKSLKRTESCIRLDRDIEQLRRDIANLSQQRDSLTNSAQRRTRRDDLVTELARNGCGENYKREYQARRGSDSFFSLWEDDDTSFDRGYANVPPEQSALPFASYRTMCVRQCDGFYFPISFSTLGSRFAEDEAKCKEQCAAPADLYVYKNPGEDVERMVSLSGEPYNNMRNAWRHRKEYIKGCSCKPEEYSLQQIQQSEQENKKQVSVSAPSGNGAARQPQSAPEPAQDGQPQAVQ